MVSCVTLMQASTVEARCDVELCLKHGGGLVTLLFGLYSNLWLCVKQYDG